jgi:predicted transcriptional regulator of viral defense system
MMNPPLNTQLKEWKKQHLKNQSPKKKLVAKKKELLSQRDLEELMGIRKPTYRRHNGALRQRG